MNNNGMSSRKMMQLPGQRRPVNSPPARGPGAVGADPAYKKHKRLTNKYKVPSLGSYLVMVYVPGKCVIS